MESEKQTYLLKYEGDCIEDHEHLIVWVSDLVEIENNYEEGYEIERKSEYDKYEKLGYVPPKVLIEDGWWFECNQCYRKIDYEYYDYEKEESLNPVFEEDKVFCSYDCKCNYQKDVEITKQLKEQYKQFVKSKFPKSDIKRIWASTKEVYIELNLPELKYPVSFNSKDETSFFIAQYDLESFRKHYSNFNLV